MPAARRSTSRTSVLPLPGGRPELGSLARVLPSGRSLLVGFGILALAIGGYLAARETSMFAVQRIEVTGARPSAVERVNAALAPLDGSSLLALDAATIDRRLAGLPDVRLISYDRAFPHTAKIVISAERPVAVLRRGSGAWLITEKGRVLEKLDDPTTWSLPRIWVADAPIPSDGALLSAEEALRPAVALGNTLSADKRFFARVGQARWVEGELELVLRTGTEIRLGEADDLALQVAVARRILDLVGSDVRYVDVSVAERAVVG